jgi:hypothetical protein
MRAKIFSAILAGGVTLAASVVMAGEAKLLSDAQMDQVSAGGAGWGFGESSTRGDVFSETYSDSYAYVNNNSLAVAENYTEGYAASVYFDASASSWSESAATLP